MADSYDDEYGPDIGPYQKTLIQTVRRHPALTTPTQGTTRQQFYQKAEEVARLAGSKPDTAELQRLNQAQYEAAGQDIGPAILLQTLGGRLAPLGGQILQKSLAARGPQKTAGGQLIGGQFVEDPYTAQERKLKAVEFGAGLYEKRAAHEETLARQIQADKQAAEDRATVERRHREQQGETAASRRDTLTLARERLDFEKGKENYTLVMDADKNPIGMFNKTTGKLEPLQSGPTPVGGKPPGQFPATPSPKASEDERRTASNVERIINSASLMTPQGATPGFMEATAGAIPKIGGGLASAVRGAGPSVGIAEPTRQQTFQSQADIIDSLLYLSTGATYTPAQLEIQREAYMPQYTDNAQAKAAKAVRLAGMIEAAKRRSGRAWTQDVENALQKVLPVIAATGEVPRGTSVLPRATAPRGPESSAADYKKRVGLN